jgi:hypothetical protein
MLGTLHTATAFGSSEEETVTVFAFGFKPTAGVLQVMYAQLLDLHRWARGFCSAWKHLASK